MNWRFMYAALALALALFNLTVAFLGPFTPLNLAAGVGCLALAIIQARDGVRARAIRKLREDLWRGACEAHQQRLERERGPSGR